MSLHKQPLTELEREGLIKHCLPVDTPSQLSDAFRLGVYWAMRQVDNELNKERPNGIEETL